MHTYYNYIGGKFRAIQPDVLDQSGQSPVCQYTGITQFMAKKMGKDDTPYPLMAAPQVHFW